MTLRVLSLFDGISCGQYALKVAEIPYTEYFAAEIDPKAIQVTQSHFPATIQLGDVTKIDFSSLPPIDLLIGGSPCQDLSRANTNGKGLEGEQSKLFWKFVEAKNTCNPRWFLLENVQMSKESGAIVSEALGVPPVLINSARFSAQSRKRLYWTNIPIAPFPVSNGLTLGDIVYDNTYKVFQDERIERTKVRTRNYFQYDLSGKGYKSQQDRAYFLTSKSPTVPKSRGESKLKIVLDEEQGIYRVLHPIEVERLQTLPDDYTAGIQSATQRIGAIGNGWTAAVIVHILKGIKDARLSCLDPK